MVSVTGVYLSTQLVSDSLEERFTRQLVEAASVAADGLVQREDVHLSTLRTIAFTEDLDEAILTADREKLETLVFPHVANNNIGLVTIVDTEGLQLLELRRPPGTKNVEDYVKRNGADLTDWAIVQKVLSAVVDPIGDKHVAWATTVDGEKLFLTAGPVKQDDKIVGAVLVGSYTYDLLRALNQATFAEVSFYNLEGDLIDTTFVNNKETATALAMEANVRNLLASEGGTSLQRNVTVNGRKYYLLFSVLRARGKPIGYYSVALQTTFMGSREITARNQLVLIFSTALLLVFGIGYLTANSITGRVQHLMENAIAVASGDFSRRTQISSSDEIGLLAQSLDHMTGNLATYTNQLQNRIDELIALYESSTAVTVKSGLNLDHVLKTITTSIKGIIEDIDQVIIYLVDERAQVLTPKDYLLEESLDETPVLSFAKNDGLGAILETYEPQVVSLSSIETYSLNGAFVNTNVKEVLIAPLIAGQEIIGMLLLMPGHRSLPEQDNLRLLGTFANQAAVSIKNAQLFEATQQAYEELRQLDDLKTKFINIAAHELRTPLGAMMGYASFVEKRAPKKLHSSARFLVASTLRMRTMVDAMLAIQRLDAGTAFLRVAPIDLHHIIQKTFNDFKPIADLENHAIKLNLPDTLPLIKADAEKIGLVLSNLLSNAIKFTPSGGCIEITAQDYILGILVSVKDNGVGIPTEDQACIFDRFYQARPKHIAGHGGIGIGLTIVKHLVELHKGQVWVESEIGQGSTFFFTLPQVESITDHPAQTTATPSSQEQEILKELS